MKRFEECKIEEGTKIKLAQDMFVFSAYAGGVRVSDLLQLKWNNYTGTHINFTIKKTKAQLSIKLPNKAISVIEKYRPEKLQANTYIFPMLKNSLNEDSLRELDKAISSATALLNKNLKQIAQKSGIERTISFHISRHTWATRALLKGMSIDKVSKLMGHSALKETQIYAKIVSEELDNAMELFN